MGLRIVMFEMDDIRSAAIRLSVNLHQERARSLTEKKTYSVGKVGNAGFTYNVLGHLTTIRLAILPLDWHSLNLLTTLQCASTILLPDIICYAKDKSHA